MAKREKVWYFLWCCPNCYTEWDSPGCDTCQTDLDPEDWHIRGPSPEPHEVPEWLTRMIAKHKGRQAGNGA